ncbi:hypothetical protein BC834DRAFT_158132 [Gloeopeniophorella convolvens]|nr:hypothetical protein BC834DRAFT_158132 [Gloeopeniophorella convolvens]
MSIDPTPAIEAAGFLTSRLLEFVANQFPSAQEKRGDKRLQEAREMAKQDEALIDPTDLMIVKERIEFTTELRCGLESSKGITKWLQAREYRKSAKNTLRFVRTASDRGKDATLGYRSQSRLRRNPSSLFCNNTLSPDPARAVPELEHVVTTARTLYRCCLSCKNAFPDPKVSAEWEEPAWIEACTRAGVGPEPLEMKPDIFAGMDAGLRDDLKARIAPHVENIYGFNTSQASESIGRNAALAQKLLSGMTFIYRDVKGSDGRPHWPYRHPIIQKAVNITWFRNKDDDGVVYHEYFSPVPSQAIALVLTACLLRFQIECCIDEWSTGTRVDSKWDYARFRLEYTSHIKSLEALREHGMRLGRDLLHQLQCDLLRDARVHAGAPPDRRTDSGRFSFDALDAAYREDLPSYNEHPQIVVQDSSDV